MKALKGVHFCQIGFFTTMFVMLLMYRWWWITTYRSIQIYPLPEFGLLGHEPAYLKVATLFQSHMEWVEKRCHALQHDHASMPCAAVLRTFCSRVMEQPIRLQMVDNDNAESDYHIDAWVYHGHNTIFLPHSTLERSTYEALIMVLLHEQFHIVLPEQVIDIAYQGEQAFSHLTEEEHCRNPDSLVNLFQN
jgi:hypothetical protein